MRRIESWLSRVADLPVRRFSGVATLMVWLTVLTVARGAERHPEPEPEVNPALVNSRNLTVSSNLLKTPSTNDLAEAQKLQQMMEEAARERKAGNGENAEKLFVRVMESNAPKELHQTAMLELAVLAQERKEYAKAQQIYTQYLKVYPHDLAAPEVLLRQGLIYREMGVPVMALSKFYAVMSSALNLKAERLDYYQRLVLQAQSEIADTYYIQGKYEEAADFFARLLKLNSPDLDKAAIHHKLVRSLSLRNCLNDVIVQAGFYLERYPDGEGAPEVRFLTADALRKLNRSREAMEQVFAFLQAQRQRPGRSTNAWIYWQQRTGNELANQLYHEGDYVNAMEIYRCLASSSDGMEWQLPALYQMGLVYERLRQPTKASDAYEQILKRQSELGTNAPSPSVSAVLNMAKWRKDFLAWQQKVDESNRRINSVQLTPLPHE